MESHKETKKTVNLNVNNASRKKKKKTVNPCVCAILAQEPNKEAMAESKSEPKESVNEKKMTKKNANAKATVLTKKATIKEPAVATKSNSRKLMAIKVADKTQEIKSKKKNTGKKSHVAVTENTIPQSIKSSPVKTKKRKNTESQNELFTEMSDKMSRGRQNEIIIVDSDDEARMAITRPARKFPMNYIPSPHGYTTKKQYNQNTLTLEKNTNISSKNLKKTASTATKKKTTKKAVIKGKRNAITKKINEKEIEKTNAAIEKRQIEKIPEIKQINKTVVLKDNTNITTHVVSENNSANEMIIIQIKNIENSLPSNNDNNTHKEQQDDHNSNDCDCIYCGLKSLSGILSLNNYRCLKAQTSINENKNEIENKDENKDKNEDENKDKNKDKNENDNEDENTKSLI